jgi:hypothetical protein
MKTDEALDSLYANCPVLRMPKRIVFMSDTHIDDTADTGDFTPNLQLFMEADAHYRENGYAIIRPGDVYDLWAYEWKDIRDAYPNLIRTLSGDVLLYGNHDHAFKDAWPEALILKTGDTEIFTCHGHRGDWINDEGWEIARWMVRHPGHMLEEMGINVDPPGSINRHAIQRERLVKWADSRKVRSVFGHIHFLETSKYYNCCGSSKTHGKVECLEFDETGFHERTWT